MNDCDKRRRLRWLTAPLFGIILIVNSNHTQGIFWTKLRNWAIYPHMTRVYQELVLCKRTFCEITLSGRWGVFAETKRFQWAFNLTKFDFFDRMTATIEAILTNCFEYSIFSCHVVKPHLEHFTKYFLKLFSHSIKI